MVSLAKIPIPEIQLFRFLGENDVCGAVTTLSLMLNGRNRLILNPLASANSVMSFSLYSKASPSTSHGHRLRRSLQLSRVESLHNIYWATLIAGWCLSDVRRSDTTYENVHYNFPIDETLLSLHISFSMANGVHVPSFYRRHDIQQTSDPFKIRLAGYQNVVLNVERTSIRRYADSFKWVIGYEHLQQHEFIFYKKNDGLHIVLVVEGTNQLADSLNNAATLLHRMHW